MTRNNWIWIIILVLLLGGIGGVLLNRYAIPYLSDIPGLSWVQKLESTSPVVINRVQQVELNEGVNLIDLVKQASGFTASIYSTGPTPKFLENGIVTSSDGMIVAAKSLLPQSGNVTVILNDGTAYSGQIRALDPKSDLGVITVPATNLAFAQFANASDLQTSQRLVILGRSGTAFSHDFSLGEVSRSIANQKSLDRVAGSEDLESSVVVNSSINANFTGGPVMDYEGRVVGMVKSDLGMLTGENLQSAVSSYLQNGKIIRPAFGIHYFDLSDELAHLKNLPQGGILIVSVDNGSPAQKAGLLAGDFIISFDNQSLASSNFEFLLNAHAISSVPITAVRAGAKVNLTINLQPK